MGSDKALLEIGGAPLWERQLRMLEQLAPPEIFLAGPRPFECDERRVFSIADAQEGCGPLGGLVAGLRRCSTPLLLVLAVDLPRMTSDYLNHLLALCAEGKGIVPFTDRLEPLAAIYPARARAIAEEFLSGENHSAQAFARRCLESDLVSTHAVPLRQREFFLNINTPAELQRAVAP